MITREQVADLQPGDVVEYRRDDWPQGCYVHSPLKVGHGIDSGLYVLDGHFGVRTPDGRPYEDVATLTVVSRAPRPLYVNHPRAKPVHGDIVRDGDGDAWQFMGDSWLLRGGTHTGCSGISDCAPLTLLWDGETGQAVQ